MLLLYSLEILFAIALAIIAITQVLVPLWTNRPLWPWFSKRAKAESALGQALENQDVKGIQRFTDRVQRGRLR